MIHYQLQLLRREILFPVFRLNPGIEPVRRRAAGRPKELVKTMFKRSTDNLPREVRMPDQFDASLLTGLINRLTIVIQKRHADMPLAGHGRGILFLPQHLWQGQTIGCDEARTLHPSEDATVVQTKRHSTGHHPIP